MSFEDFFDFDGDGKLNVIEQATAYNALFGNEDSDEIGYHSPYDDDDDEPAEAYDEYDEYDDYSDDEFEDEDEEEEGEPFNWDEDAEPVTGSTGSKKGLKSYKDRLSRIIELIEKITSDTDSLLFDVELNPSDTDEKYEMIEALENAKLDLDLLTADLEKVLE